MSDIRMADAKGASIDEGLKARRPISLESLVYAIFPFEAEDARLYYSVFGDGRVLDYSGSYTLDGVRYLVDFKLGINNENADDCSLLNLNRREAGSGDDELHGCQLFVRSKQ